MTSRIATEQYHEVHLVGISLGHSLTPLAHNFVANSLDINWRIFATECPTIEDCVRIFRSRNQAGGIITMPWKGEIMKHLDRIDEHARILKACNSVYFDGNGHLCGSNTDWRGIEGALRAAGFEGQSTNGNHTAAIIGAGGAARAGIYALTKRFGIKTVYVLNRDDAEVSQLLADCQQMEIRLLHIKSVGQLAGNEMPSVIISSVPDFEAITPAEKNARQLYQDLLSQTKGTMVDFCYSPLQTRNVQLAEDHGWQAVRGIEIIGHQVEALWRLWIDEKRLSKIDRQGMWKLIREAATLNSKSRNALNAEILKEHFGNSVV